MKYIALYFSIVLLFTACQDDDGFVKEVNFDITNTLEYSIDGKIFTTNGSSEEYRDSTNFLLEENEAKSILWKKPEMKGEGSFRVFADGKLSRRFGYFTNGVSLTESFTLSITADSIVVQ